MASTKLTRTNGTATTGNKYTWSAWVKRGFSGTQETLVRTRTDDNNYSRIRFDDDGTLVFEDRISSSTVTNLVSNAKHRDLSAWYHVVVRVDYTQATAGDRARIYVNGSEVTYSTTTRQSQNGSSYFNSANSHDLGHYNSNNYFNGSMTHVHFTDGYSYAPSTFGETDSTSGIWKPKTAPSVTYGNNGYFLKMENSGAMGTDSSGNSNTFTVSGTLTQNVDTPSNNFCTLNPNDRAITGTAPTLANGNLTFTSSGAGAGSNNAVRSTLGVSKGKWYWESKWLLSYTVWGMQDADTLTRWNSDGYWWVATGSFGASNIGDITVNGTQTSSVFTALSTNDIVGFAYDLDNSKFYVSVNGVYVTSGDPTSGATGTGSLGNLTAGKTYVPIIGNSSYNSVSSANLNFGNGYFGTTAVASANADDGGLGAMEYDVPANYRVLCTKNIKDYG